MMRHQYITAIGMGLLSYQSVIKFVFLIFDLLD